MIANETPNGTGGEGGGENEGHPLAGRWRGQIYGASNGFESALELEVTAACAMREPCGSHRLRNKCAPGAGDFYTLLDDDTLRYHTNYDDVTGTLTRVD